MVPDALAVRQTQEILDMQTMLSQWFIVDRSQFKSRVQVRWTHAEDAPFCAKRFPGYLWRHNQATGG